METDQIVKNIYERRVEILKNLKPESVAVYLFLKDEYVKGEILKNLVFQFVFRSYYRLDNAGLSDDIKNRFFELLSEKQADLKTILSELYDIPTKQSKNTIQFAFATKLLHTINNDLPIYDSKVGRIFNMRLGGVDKKTKIESCVKIYENLKYFYAELKKDKKIQEVISEFKKKLKIDAEKISDTKALDFIIWSLGKLEANEENFSDELLEAVKEAKKEYKGGKIKSFKSFDSLRARLKKI